jgi:ABC-type multidrug transport system fused ATPase/permease subunit
MRPNTRSSKVWRILSYARPYRRQLSLILLCMILSTVLSLPQPIVLKLLIDDVLVTGNLPMLNLLLGGLLGLYILQNVVSFAQRYLSSIVGQRLLIDIRQQIYAHLQRLSPKFYNNAQTGDLLSRTLYDANSLQALASTMLIDLLTNVATLLVISGIIFYMDWRLALVSCATVPAFASVILVFNKRIRRASIVARQETAQVNAHLQENLSGIRLIQAFAREAYEKQRFLGQLRKLARASIHSDIVNWQAGVIGGVIVFIGPLIVLWFGGVQVIRGALTVGSLIAFYSYLGKLYSPTNTLVQMTLGLQGLLAGIDRAFALLDTPIDVEERPDARTLPSVQGLVELKNVSFQHADNGFALQNLSFVAEPGTCIAIVGPSGAGKSTLVNLLCRFYDPLQGSITLDGYDLRDLKLDFLRQQIGVVSQDTFLFNASLQDNIGYGRADATEEEIVEAARMAEIHDFIAGLPQGYDTVVGERGVKLSGGQKQRIAIARAILRDPKILILDEATSSLDANVEASIQAALEPLMASRTTFIVAHRLSTVRNADHILVLDEGRIVDRGTHWELLQLDGLYQELYARQMADHTAPVALAPDRP